MREGWGDENSALMRIFSSVFLPGASTEDVKWFAHLQRVSGSAETAVRLRAALDDIDLTDLLPRVSAPTLVLHSRYDNVQPFEEGRCIASSIPHAKFVSLVSENHIPYPASPRGSSFCRRYRSFCPSLIPRPGRQRSFSWSDPERAPRMANKLFAGLNLHTSLAAMHERVGS